MTSQLGYLPSDMLKKPLHEFCIAQDQSVIKDQMKLIYETKQTQPVQITLHFVPSSSSNENNAAAAAVSDKKPEAIKFKTSAYAFCNPCNEAFEFIVCTHVNQSRLNELNSNNSTNSSGFMYNNANSTSGATSSNGSSSSSSQNNNYMHHIQSQQVAPPPPSHLVDPLQQQQSAYPVYQSLGTYNLAGASGNGASSTGVPPPAAAYMAADAHSQLQQSGVDPQSAFYSTNYLMMSNKY